MPWPTDLSGAKPQESSRRVLIATLGLAGTALALAVLTTFLSHPPAPRHEMVAALAGRRPFLSRFTGGFLWAPPAATSPAVRGEIARLVRQIEREAERNRTPHNIADAAVLRLLLGQPGGALERLRRAAESAPRDAELMNDLAAAYLASYEVSHDPSELVTGLETAERALALPGAPAEALFNRALAMEELFLHQQARLAWVRYLSADPGSPWAKEARSRLAQLDQASEDALWLAARDELVQAVEKSEPGRVKRLVGRFPQRARLWAEEDLLPSWGRAWEEGHETAAARFLGTARAIGVALADHHGERMLLDTVAAVEEARDRRSRLTALARGHLAYARGLELYRAAQDTGALQHFTTAARLLASAASPYSGWARFRAALCAFYAGDNRGVLSALAALERDLAMSSYPSLLGRARLLEGMAHLRLAEMADSLRCYRLGLAAFTPTDEKEHIAAAHLMTAENLSYQGDAERAWEHRIEALSLSHRIGGSVYYYNTLRDGAEDLLRRGRLRGALALQSEMVAWSRRERDPLVMTETLLARSRTYLRLGDRQRATGDLDRAGELLMGVAQGERRLRLATDLRLARAEMDLASDASVKSISSAIVWATQRRDRFRLPGLFAKRAQARLSAGDLDGAITDLDAAIAESERQRSEVREEPLRVSYLDQALPLYEEMVSLQMKRGRPDLAFGFAERVRARRLAERTSSVDTAARPAAMLGLNELAGRMPEGTSLVELAVLTDRTVAWLAGRGWTKVVELPIGRAELEQEVANLRGLIGRGSTASLARSIEVLSRALLQPLLTHLPEGEHLVIVPDECLYLVPFALLRDPGSGKYLIERMVLSYAPSASLYLKTLAREGGQPARPLNSVLVLADPKIDAAAFPELPSLPGAAAEAAGVAALYPTSDVLTGRMATRAAFLARVPRYDVVHLAAHALPNLEYPLLSALPLAHSSHGSDAIYAHEIEQLDLHRTRLVVLGACATSLGRLSLSEGVFSLARPFLLAGVPAVVTSLWTIDDRAAQRLLIEFHHRLREGGEAAAALRGAQLTLLHSGQPELAEPHNWAAFQLIGELRPATVN